jgi:hypothetical protein
MAWQHVSPEVIGKSPVHYMGLMIIHYRVTVKRKGMLAVSVRKMKALSVKMDWTLCRK